MEIKIFETSKVFRIKSYDHRFEKCPNTEFSGPYFLVLGQNMGRYGPEKTPYLNTFHLVDYY